MCRETKKNMCLQTNTNKVTKCNDLTLLLLTRHIVTWITLGHGYGAHHREKHLSCSLLFFFLWKLFISYIEHNVSKHWISSIITLPRLKQTIWVLSRPSGQEAKVVAMISSDDDKNDTFYGLNTIRFTRRNILHITPKISKFFTFKKFEVL